MLNDKNNNIFTYSKITGNNLQLTVNIPRKDWKYFKVGSRVKIMSLYNINIVKKVRSIGNSKQRIITIPSSDKDIFKKYDIVKLYPYK